MEKRKMICLFLALLLAFILTYILYEYVDKPKISNLPPLKHDISSKISEYEIPIEGYPGYFHSVGKLYFIMRSEYIEYFEKINISVSLDKYSWKEVHITYDGPNTDEQMIYLGYVDLRQLKHPIYIRIYVPPQILKIPGEVSKEEILKSFNGHIEIKREKNWIVLIIVFIACFGAIHIILDSFQKFRKLPLT